MMLDRNKLGFWTRFVAIALAVIFVASSVFLGVGTDVSYNLFELLGGSPDEQQEQTTGSEEQVARAQEALEEEPENPRAIRRLAGVYLQDGQADAAIQVLENGREIAPDDPVIALYLGQAYERQAQGVADEEERQGAYEQAGDAYAAAADLQEDEAQPYLLAGQAYEQAEEPGRAIQYWNDYLDLEPDGEASDQVRERIETLLSGGETTGPAAGGAPDGATGAAKK